VAKLPTDKRGFPVPSISCWSSANDLRPGELMVPVEGVPNVEAVEIMAATCNHVAGEGTPDLANLCAGKQITMMTQRRCDVCDDPISGSCHFIGQVSNEWFREAPLHWDCAVYSLQVCPGISTGEGVGVQTCDAYDLTPVFIQPVSGGGTEEVPYPSFFAAVLSMQVTQRPGVLVACHARPINPVVRTREEFLGVFL
jgi:hypothetical protein